MGLLSFLSFAICGGAMINDSIKKSSMTEKSKEKAIQKGRATYTDYKGNKNGKIVDRALSTNEITFFNIDRDGNRQMVGVKTGNVYSSFNPRQEWLDKMNKKAKDDGKKFYYKEFPQFRDVNGKPEILKCNIENDKPYEISYRAHINSKERWCMVYYDLSSTRKCLWPSDEIYYLTEEEAEPYFEYKKNNN